MRARKNQNEWASTLNYAGSNSSTSVSSPIIVDVDATKDLGNTSLSKSDFNRIREFADTKTLESHYTLNYNKNEYFSKTKIEEIDRRLKNLEKGNNSPILEPLSEVWDNEYDDRWDEVL